MISTNRQITSREYKLPLNAERFQTRAAGTQAFWNLVVFLAGQQDLEVVPGDEDPDKEENPQGEEKRRTVHYLDTAGFELQRQGAIVRLRYESKEKKPYKVMLKYRSPDRYLYERVAKLRGTAVAEGRDGMCEACHVRMRLQIWVR